jgi:hypothetical protein
MLRRKRVAVAAAMVWEMRVQRGGNENEATARVAVRESIVGEAEADWLNEIEKRMRTCSIYFSVLRIKGDIRWGLFR